jgi:hypothetical protein
MAPTFLRAASQRLTETKCTQWQIGTRSLQWQITKTNHYGKQGSVWNLHGNLKGKYGIVPRASCHARSFA